MSKHKPPQGQLKPAMKLRARKAIQNRARDPSPQEKSVNIHTAMQRRRPHPRRLSLPKSLQSSGQTPSRAHTFC